MSAMLPLTTCGVFTTAIPGDLAFHRPVLFFCFHALQTHRLHTALSEGPQGFAYYLEPLVAVFQTDINPASRIARIFLIRHRVCVRRDRVHEDDVSILHGVHARRYRKENEDRHPKNPPRRLDRAAPRFSAISRSPLARIAAGSVVVKPVPHNVTVAGRPCQISARRLRDRHARW